MQPQSQSTKPCGRLRNRSARCQLPLSGKRGSADSVSEQPDLQHSAPRQSASGAQVQSKKSPVRITRPLATLTATLTVAVMGTRSSDSVPRECGGSDATYRGLWAAIEQDLHAPATKVRIDAPAEAALGAFIRNRRTKNRERAPIEAWPTEIAFK